MRLHPYSIVKFCPFRGCSLSTASQAGVLQPFYVTAFQQEPVYLVTTLLLIPSHCEVLSYQNVQTVHIKPNCQQLE